jgi:hypothetical protein
MKKYNYKDNIAELPKEKFGDSVKIRFDEDKPTLIIADNVADNVKDDAITFTELMFIMMGGEVKFFPELAVHVD